jgi:hypothetical protein
MQTPLAMAFNAEGAIAAYSIVKAGASGGALAAAAATDKILGVSTDIAAAQGETVDVLMDGICFVTAGGNIAQGDLLTSNAAGAAVTAAPAAGSNVRLVGIAMEAAVAGDVFRVMLQPGSLQG